MPVGPRALMSIFQQATTPLNLVLDQRLLLYRCFERVVMSRSGELYEILNAGLARQNILPHLRNPPDASPPEAGANAKATATATDADGGQPKKSDRASPEPAPVLRLQHGPEFYGRLRRLLGDCRRAATCTASDRDLQVALSTLQSRQATTAVADARLQLYSGGQLQQEMLALLYDRRTDGRCPQLSDEDTDIIDLCCALFEFLARRAWADGTVYWLLARLQIPVLRAALHDRSFFFLARNPVRQMLGFFVDTGQFWIDENEAAPDPALVETMRRLVHQIACEYHGDDALFTQADDELRQCVDTLIQKTQALERHHVKAAIEHDRHDRARRLAKAAVAERLDEAHTSEFLRTLLEHGWIDALTAALLHEGENGDGYARGLAVMDRMLTAERGQESQQAFAAEREELLAGLALIGLHENDAQAIAYKLLADTKASQPENPMSQTELAIRLKSRARHGAEPPASVTPSPAFLPDQAMQPDEREALDRLCALDSGSWLEFLINPENDKIRRKLAWFSRHTGRCLLINQRGTPSQDITMQQLAKDVAAGRVRVGLDQRSIIDAAWETLCKTWQTFLGRDCGWQPEEIGVDTPAARGLAGQTAEANVLGETAAAAHDQPTLLLVDDEVNIQRALTRVLRNNQYRIVCATSADQATDMLAQQKIDVIISDQRMPGVSGTEFLAKVKSDYPETVRLLLSGYSDAAMVTDAINRGVIYKFLTKPWNDEDLRDQVAEAFAASRRQAA